MFFGATAHLLSCKQLIEPETLSVPGGMYQGLIMIKLLPAIFGCLMNDMPVV